MTERVSMRDLFMVDVPEGELDGIRVERFTVEAHSLERMRLLRDGRGLRPGVYTRLMKDRQLWMSDTDAEQRDHYEPYFQMTHLRAERVLVNGLGLGMIVKAALSLDHVQHVDVVEIDPRVIALVGPHYTASGRVTIHEADAFTQARRGWVPGAQWDVAWHDIWLDGACTEDYEGMKKLHRSYGRRVQWQSSWGFHEAQQNRRRERAGAW